MIKQKNLFSYTEKIKQHPKAASFLPMTRKEMDKLGWDNCDVIIVTGDAYVDHPSFGMAIIGRLLEAQGFKVGIIAQPDWRSKNDFMKLGVPNIMFGVTSGNMDSMVNQYTSDLRIRSNDAYTPDGIAGKRPDRAVIVYSQRCREAYSGVPIVLGGIEASLRRVAHYDYWSDKIRRSIILDSKADILIYGSGERQIVDIAFRLKAGEPVKQITDVRGTAFVQTKLQIGCNKGVLLGNESLSKKDQNQDSIKIFDSPQNKSDVKTIEPSCKEQAEINNITEENGNNPLDNELKQLPSFDQINNDPGLLADATYILLTESQKSNMLIQPHGERNVCINPPSPPLTTDEMDKVYELPFARKPHPIYNIKKIPAFEMIRFSVTITRGCFGGCAFCSIVMHEGRVVQNRSESSVIHEINEIQDKTPGYTGTISDLGGPTANMYRMQCKKRDKRKSCLKLSCLYPSVCKNLDTDHSHLISLYRKVRKLNGIKRVLIGSGVRYDLAVLSPDYIKELAHHHVGGYLKIAPEHTQAGPLSVMMKPGIESYNKFKSLFFKYSIDVGKKQYLIPYFIAAHPGTTTNDMVELALWLKLNDFKLDQVQTFLPSPMTVATATYCSGQMVGQKMSKDDRSIFIPKGLKIRRIHKAFLRYHDPENWPLLRKTLIEIGRKDLIGNKPQHLIPSGRSKRRYN